MKPRKWLSFFGKALLLAAGVFLPFIASAHEVYVLTKSEIAQDLLYPPINLFAVAVSQKYLFLTIVVLGILVVLAVLGLSLSRGLERVLDPVLLKIKPYAAHIAQVAVGFALLASAYHGALFGTELPFGQLFGSHVFLVTVLLYIAGASILFGIYPRIGALIVLVAYLWAALGGTGVYMLSYLTYFGEALVIFLFGAGYSILHSGSGVVPASKIMAALKKREHFMVRVAFSTALIYSALYAKLIHGTLALNTVTKYHLTNYFHFDPLFIVLGAFMIEMLIGLFYLIGFEIRFTSLFFLMFLTMSLVFFGESVWPHIVLIGSAVALFVHGYDEFTVERWWYTKGIKEPVL